MAAPIKTLANSNGAHEAKTVSIERVETGIRNPYLDTVAVEEPLEIRLVHWVKNKPLAKSISITMRTPGQDDELALGFLLSEGIIRHAQDIEAIGHCGPSAADGLRNVIKVELGRRIDVDIARLERHFYTTSSCGVCGKTSLEALAVQGQFEISAQSFSIDAVSLIGLPAGLRQRQSVFEYTGGLHASGLFDSRGSFVNVREDVGRHNALDKLIGSALQNSKLPLSDNGIIVSGRTSFELLQKAMMAGCPFMAAVGAPSSLAVELAQEFGITLVGFLKDDRFNIYAGSQRVAN